MADSREVTEVESLLVVTWYNVLFNGSSEPYKALRVKSGTLNVAPPTAAELPPYAVVITADRSG